MGLIPGLGTSKCCGHGQEKKKQKLTTTKQAEDVGFFWFVFCFCVFSFFCFLLFRATPAAYGGSQAKGPIGAIAASLLHSHIGSESHLRPTPQLTAMPDP